MAYFAAIKITDINGNVVELVDVTQLLESINKELAAIHTILSEMAETDISKEEIEDGH
jgi:hypothetical protein